MAAVTHTGGHEARFEWVWTGTNTGPGGTGRSVHLTGCEEWTSLGRYDQAEYERQLAGRFGLA